MGRLAEIAKAASGQLKGKITVNFADGTTRTFHDEAAAEKATAGLDLRHERGSFFAKAAVKEVVAKIEGKAVKGEGKLAGAENIEKAAADKTAPKK